VAASARALCWPELGVFLELDGQQHKDQPVYDASRQNRIAIATGWRPGRYTWDQIKNFAKATLREIAALLNAVPVA
jgi:very-short-patch-repair endonuclease